MDPKSLGWKLAVFYGARTAPEKLFCLQYFVVVVVVALDKEKSRAKGGKKGWWPRQRQGGEGVLFN